MFINIAHATGAAADVATMPSTEKQIIVNDMRNEKPLTNLMYPFLKREKP